LADRQTLSRRRAQPDAQRIAARAAGREVALVRDRETGVVPLNPGFFAVERLRGAAAKARSSGKARVRSK
jgi:hypothetical protein